MSTKTDLLNQLTIDQLMEIAVAEDIEVPETCGKKEVIQRLLKLPMEKIRRHVDEYLEHDKRKHGGILEPLLDKASGFLGDDFRDLIREEMTKGLQKDGSGARGADYDDLGEKIKERVLGHLQEKRTRKPAISVKEQEAPERRQVQMPDSLPDRVKTGYQDLDNLLFGGIPKDYAVILTSPSCDERELLIKSFLEAGAKEGQITFFVTVEASEGKALAEEFQSNFYLFICNPQADTIIQSLPNVFKLKGVENLTDINIALTSAIRQLDTSMKAPRRACIEIISDVLLQHHAVPIRRWLTSLVPELKSRGFTTLAVMNPHMHPSQEVQAILDIFDGEIDIYEKPNEKGSGKFLKVAKMINQRYLDDELLVRKERINRSDQARAAS